MNMQEMEKQLAAMEAKNAALTAERDTLREQNSSGFSVRAGTKQIQEGGKWHDVLQNGKPVLSGTTVARVPGRKFPFAFYPEEAEMIARNIDAILTGARRADVKIAAAQSRADRRNGNGANA